MTITIIVGGQFGSEGKGKITGYLAPEFKMAIRSGGPNAGHTVEHDGKVYKLRMVPCAFFNPKCLLGVAAGAVIDTSVILSEIAACNLNEKRLLIDPQAVIIEERHKQAEANLVKAIASTGEGVGSASADKVARVENLHLARDVPELKRYLGDVAKAANHMLDAGGKVLLEGTQGFGLSLHHGFYPFVTSRDTTAGALCSEVGVSPRFVEDIILVVRTYPIRVGGNSGPLKNEITWEDLTVKSNSPTALLERTTVTGRIRRVGNFNMNLVKRAVMINRPTQIALTFVDYIDHRNFGTSTYRDLTASAKRFIKRLETETKVPVTLIGTGPISTNIIDLRKEKSAKVAPQCR